MTESVQMGRLLIGNITLLAFVMLYAAGGGSHRELYRRILGSMVFSTGCSSLARHNWHWLFAASWPAYFGALTMGYSADKLPSKLRKRALYGLVVGLVSGVWLLPLGAWSVLLFQVILAIMASVFYGVLNPQSRVGEEGAIALLMVVTVPFKLV